MKNQKNSVGNNGKFVYVVSLKRCLENRFVSTFTMVCFVTIAILFFVIYFGNRASARDFDAGRTKYYTSIQIQEGDSLWSIAEEYISEEYDSVQEYIEELKRVNCLERDVIHEGKYLIVAYYK